jgi:hypothetical protein
MVRRQLSEIILGNFEHQEGSALRAAATTLFSTNEFPCGFRFLQVVRFERLSTEVRSYGRKRMTSWGGPLGPRWASPGFPLLRNTLANF